MEICYIDGRFCRAEEASIPVTDLLVQRGVGIFESISCPDGHPFALDMHLARLHRSADSLRIVLPMTNDEIRDIIAQGIKRYGGECLARIYVSGGDKGDCAKGFTEGRTFFLFSTSRRPSEEDYERGVGLFALPFERYWWTAKTVNYARPIVWGTEHPHDLEGLYCPNGEITESATSSFFLWKDDRLVTAPLSRVLDGTTRRLVMIVATEAGISIEERCPSLQELQQNGEAFVTSTSRWIMPVTSFQNAPVGTGRPGQRTLDLHRRFTEAAQRWITVL